VYTNGNGVHCFTLDPSVGEFLISSKNITIPDKAKTYSVNEGNYGKWSDGMKKYVSYLKESDPKTSRPYSSRYIGSLVADFHRNLIYGGIFMYPADAKNKNGKLRLMYEANPLSFIVEQAGGRSSDGSKRILEVKPESLHQRTPLFIGSKHDVMLVEEFLKNEVYTYAK
jgi:fructose-1,6-bisphosphatase I